MIHTNRKVANPGSESRLEIPDTSSRQARQAKSGKNAQSSPIQTPIQPEKPAKPPQKPTKHPKSARRTPYIPTNPPKPSGFDPSPHSPLPFIRTDPHYNSPDYLTPQQLKQQEKLFIKSILKGMSTQEAALIAGYPQNPSDLGVALMSNPHIRNTIESHWADILHNEGINMLNVVREIAHIALFDPRALINPETGKYIPLHLLPRNVAAAVDSLDMEETEFNDVSTVTRVKYKLSNKLKALQQLGEYLGLFNQTQRVEVTGKDGAPIQMEVQMSPTEIARRVAFVLQQAPEVVDAVESTE